MKKVYLNSVALNYFMEMKLCENVWQYSICIDLKRFFFKMDF